MSSPSGDARHCPGCRGYTRDWAGECPGLPVSPAATCIPVPAGAQEVIDAALDAYVLQCETGPPHGQSWRDAGQFIGQALAEAGLLLPDAELPGTRSGDRRPHMARKQSGLPRGLRGGSDTRKLIDAIIAAGVPRENIEMNGGGHLKVTCPDGSTAVVGAVLKTPGAYASARAELARHGVAIPARGGGGNRGNRVRHHLQRRPGSQQPDRYSGIVTRYRDGEFYAFVTADDGGTWFIAVPQLPPETARELAYGRRVTFGGNPMPEPGRRYPSASGVRLAPPGEPEPPTVARTPLSGTGSTEPASSLPADFITALAGIREQLCDGAEDG